MTREIRDKSNSWKILMVFNDAMKNYDYLSLNNKVYIHVHCIGDFSGSLHDCQFLKKESFHKVIFRNAINISSEFSVLFKNF
jgi:hypothetical protein